MAGCAAPWTSPWGPAGTSPLSAPPIAIPAPDRPAAITVSQGHEVTVRGQNQGDANLAAPNGGGYWNGTAPGGYGRGPQAVSGGVPPVANGYAPNPSVQPAVAAVGSYNAANYAQAPLPPPPAAAMQGVPSGASPFTPEYPAFQPPSNIAPEALATPTPLDVFVEETRTGRFMFGVTVNSNAGLLGQITLSEQNFDIMKPPASWDDFLNGTAWRGAGQGFRLEAQPGNQLQRYLISFTEPYFLGSEISFNASAFFFNRAYFDWTEERFGGRLAFGRRLTPDLSLSASIRAESVDIYDPRVAGVPALDSVLGKNDLYSGRVTLTHDTRDLPFMPTEGHLIEASYEQVFGSFDYPRGDFEYAQYFLVRQRPDGGGRHTIALTTKLGVSGTDTPIFENYFAGGFSTLRGFQFRGASPIAGGVRVGGRFQWINSLEYFFPITADDMIRGTVFCDFGTVEREVALHGDNFRVAPGFGLRINVPALGPAPLAFDFAFPVASATTDEDQVFSFFFGAMR
jgi:outer membrane protein insertion porin family